MAASTPRSPRCGPAPGSPEPPLRPARSTRFDPVADPRPDDTADANVEPFDSGGPSPAGEAATPSAAGASRRPASTKPRRSRGAAKAEAGASPAGPGSRGRAAAEAPASPRQGAATGEDWLADIAKLSYQEARTALELALAQLQSSELEVEEMAGLYRRAQAYAERCEAVLQQVEQDVIQWDPQTLAPPAP